jgi:hypothetical protein
MRNVLSVLGVVLFFPAAGMAQAPGFAPAAPPVTEPSVNTTPVVSTRARAHSVRRRHSAQRTRRHARKHTTTRHRRQHRSRGRRR